MALFSVIFLVVAGGLAFCVMLAIARMFLPIGMALVAAVLMTGAGGASGFVSLVIEAMIVRDTLKTGAEFIGFFLIGLVVAFAGAAGALWAILRWRARRVRRTMIAEFD